MLKISFEKALAKATGREYEYISISVDGLEINRIFFRQTERSYYESLVGDYERQD